MLLHKLKVIFIPGNGGATVNDHWFPHLREELSYYGVKVISEYFPDPMLARAQYWLPFIDKMKPDEYTILVGHSTGATAALRYTEQKKVLGSVLVAPNISDLDDPHEKLSGYFDIPWNWQNIRDNQDWIIHFASKDDPYVPIDESRHIGKMHGGDYFEREGYGHFGDDIGLENFDELVHQVKHKLGVDPRSKVV